ncbi:hypothetical protein COCNU_03G009470 [Cocos nucifera]|uniref:Uncharacterized protein n=1 Tax=Cocos nucifera TaxID=13894 RepID=A0A8K0MYT8_COCNU|nr:hypothetical protein COCNU_03G009470 [Cocos nucifera]
MTRRLNSGEVISLSNISSNRCCASPATSWQHHHRLDVRLNLICQREMPRRLNSGEVISLSNISSNRCCASPATQRRDARVPAGSTKTFPLRLILLSRTAARMESSPEIWTTAAVHVNMNHSLSHGATM